jgi:hypothetical protein
MPNGSPAHAAIAGATRPSGPHPPGGTASCAMSSILAGWSGTGKRYVRGPQTGQRLPRLDPASAWLVTEVPELRIVGRRALAAGAGPAGLDPSITERRQGADGQVLEAPPRPLPVD